MSEEILINVTPRETRVALVENGVLNEVFIERTRRRGLVGNIYKGRVNRVLPGMQAAFVDIGTEKAAYLHASDIGKEGGGRRFDSDDDDEDDDGCREDFHCGSVLVGLTIVPTCSSGAGTRAAAPADLRMRLAVPRTAHLGPPECGPSPTMDRVRVSQP